MWKHHYLVRDLVRGIIKIPALTTRLPSLLENSYKVLGESNTNLLLEKTIYPLYCGSDDKDKLESTIRELERQKINTILHLASESMDKMSPEDCFKNLYHKIPLLGKGSMVALKLTSFYSREQMLDMSLEVTPELVFLIRFCIQHDLSVAIDAEESELGPGIRKITRNLMKQFNRVCCQVYPTYQCYLRETPEVIKNEYMNAKKNGYVFGAKLVRGAYLEYEKNKPVSPVFDNYEMTGQCYKDIGDYLLSNGCPVVIATHNSETTKYFITKYPESWARYAQLLGMNDELTQYLLKKGVPTYKFVPYGPTEIVMPYLVRRLKENRDLLQYT